MATNRVRERGRTKKRKRGRESKRDRGNWQHPAKGRAAQNHAHDGAESKKGKRNGAEQGTGSGET
jgi:hypothetical protein